MSTPDIKTASGLEAYYVTYIEAINRLPEGSIDEFLADQITRNDIPTVNRKEYTALIKPGCVFRIESTKSNVEGAELIAELHIDFPDGRQVHETARYHFDSEWRIDDVHSELTWLKGGPDWGKWQRIHNISGQVTISHEDEGAQESMAD